MYFGCNGISKKLFKFFLKMKRHKELYDKKVIGIYLYIIVVSCVDVNWWIFLVNEDEIINT